MGLFSRRSPADTDVSTGSALPGPTPVGAFWDWWAERGRHLDPTTPGPDHDTLGELLVAVDPGLSWHFGPGLSARHRLTVSAGGTADARPAAERWFRAAPAADGTWEFAPAVAADHSALEGSLEVGGATVDLPSVVLDLRVDLEDLRVHVGVHHPAFADLPDQVATQIAFMVLDWALGEDDVSRWVGHVAALPSAPASSRDVDDLVAAVATCAAEHEPDTWSVLSGEDEQGRPVFALARRGARWVDRPTLDLHHALTATFVPDKRGLPSPDDLVRLQALDESLLTTVEPRGLVLAHVTTDGTRTLHVYTDGEDQNVAADVTGWAASHGLEAASALDPGWTRVRHLLG